MIPKDQTIFGPVNGNCFQACLASILELPLELIPNFCGLYRENYYGKLVDWLDKIGLTIVTVNLEGVPDDFSVKEFLKTKGHVIISGKSPRFDCNHSVVFFRGKLVHDPHPDRTGVEDMRQVDFILPNRIDWIPGSGLKASNIRPLRRSQR